MRLWNCRVLLILEGCALYGSASSYYETLGLTTDATAQDVRRQFRKLSVQHHPDKNPEANTAQGRAIYTNIQTANEWLADDDKRQLYDLYGEWSSLSDQTRGNRFAGRHNVEFFRDEPLITNVHSESEAQTIFGLKSKRAHLMLLYSPWLTDCMEVTTVYRRVAANLREVTGEDGIRLAAVNCESNLQQFCLRYGRLRHQFELPVVLLLDPTDSNIDRYRGRISAQELSEYAISFDQGMRHVHNLDRDSFARQVGRASDDFWLVLFCTTSERLCKEVKPVLKRLAFSAKEAAKVGFVTCREQRGADGYTELEAFCEEQGVREVPALMAFRRGKRSEQRGEEIPLLPHEGSSQMDGPLLVLQAMEAILRMSGPALVSAIGEDGGGEEEAAGHGEEL